MTRLKGPILAIGAAMIAAPALADPDGRWAYDHHMWGGGWGGMAFGAVAMLLFWVAVIAAVVLAVRWLTAETPRNGRGSDAQAEDQALRILRERFARGEIDEEEFARRRQALEG